MRRGRGEVRDGSRDKFRRDRTAVGIDPSRAKSRALASLPASGRLFVYSRCVFHGGIDRRGRLLDRTLSPAVIPPCG